MQTNIRGGKMKKSESILENLSLIMVVVALILFWLNDKKTKYIKKPKIQEKGYQYIGVK